MSLVIAVAAGGALGALGRYVVISWFGRRLGTGFPWGTLAVNAAGSFLLGAFVALSGTAWPLPLELRRFVAVGLLGAFTTVSTFAMDAAYLHGRHRQAAAAAYVAGSLLLSLTTAFLGYHLAG